MRVSDAHELEYSIAIDPDGQNQNTSKQSAWNAECCAVFPS